MFVRSLFLILATTALAACASTPRQVAQPQPPRQAAPRIVTVQPLPPQLAPRASTSVPEGLRQEIAALWRAFPGKTGIAVRRIDGDWVIGQRGAELFPQQSVSKLWVAMTVLERVDRGELRLDAPVTITRDDLTLFHQPLAARVAREGRVEASVRSLIDEALTASDNSANDALLRTAGGPAAVNDFLRRKGLNNIRFGPGERLLQSGIAGVQWRQELSAGRAFQAERARVPLDRRRNLLSAYVADPIDGASPEAMVDALARLALGQLLSPESTRLMLDTLTRTKSGPNRLKAGVPAGWRFLHKTGTGQDLPPVSTGYNDVGIMTAPDGTRYAVAVMLGETSAPIPARMQLMQSVSRAIARYHQQ
ncbi:class A beta-lactamase [Blastomonas sp.]|uniref:class A beta-lactamase n=1 Tax=Blastomonas sp. TaxID=1909299 RepID=UPI0035943252